MFNCNNWDNLEWQIVREGVKRKVFTGEGATVVLNELQPNHEPKPHKHVHEQIVYIMQGTCDFHVEDEVYSLKEGGLLVIPSNAVHYIVVTSDIPVLNLDIFTPKREEYLG